MKFSKKFATKEEKELYIRISLIVWGTVPVDVEWAEETQIYKQAKANLQE